ncbi:hypothetical protein HRbin29_02328 [bacterium HR29]|jgi:hypothetical protein|nr:hypothetical protein HRbin29_02328 [bacterium HR29]
MEAVTRRALQLNFARLRPLLGSTAAVGAFAFAFALHMAAGAAGLDWLFAAAVGLIYLSAASLPAVAWMLGGRRRRSPVWWVLHTGLALVFAGGALWASAGRELEWWVPPGAASLVAAGTLSAVLLAGFARRSGAEATRRDGRRTPRHR